MKHQDNKIENLINYQVEFNRGFHNIYNLILDKKEILLSENSPIKYFENLNIRFIYRSTGVYFKFLKALNKPEYLRDATKYGIKIELLARAYSLKSKWPPIYKF